MMAIFHLHKVDANVCLSTLGYIIRAYKYDGYIPRTSIRDDVGFTSCAAEISLRQCVQPHPLGTKVMQYVQGLPTSHDL